MSLFPFLIIVTALAAFVSSQELADEAARLILEAWPKEVAEPIASEIKTVLTNIRGDALTLGAILALYFASSGVESLRIGLNRAYGGEEKRGLVLLRLESILFVIVGAAAILALAFLVVLGPTMLSAVTRRLPDLSPLWSYLIYWRLVIASSLLIVALLVAHLWLPAGRRRLSFVWPGVVTTLGLWLAGGIGFGRYLDGFAVAYVTTYAGLATGMIALVFLYLAASIFIYGAELNAIIARQVDDAKAALVAEKAGSQSSNLVK
jgi:membrane protein